MCLILKFSIAAFTLLRNRVDRRSFGSGRISLITVFDPQGRRTILCHAP
jgi:hypothetical protein